MRGDGGQGKEDGVEERERTPKGWFILPCSKSRNKHPAPASATTSTHFSFISCLHPRCTYRVELSLCKHSICWQLC